MGFSGPDRYERPVDVAAFQFRSPRTTEIKRFDLICTHVFGTVSFLLCVAAAIDVFLPVAFVCRAALGVCVWDLPTVPSCSHPRSADSQSPFPCLSLGRNALLSSIELSRHYCRAPAGARCCPFHMTHPSPREKTNDRQNETKTYGTRLRPPPSVTREETTRHRTSHSMHAPNDVLRLVACVWGV